MATLAATNEPMAAVASAGAPRPRRVRMERTRHVEVIAVTAARDLESVREARANGVRHYLVKPFTAAALAERLDDVARHLAALLSTRRGEPLDQSTVDRILAGTAERTLLPPKGLSPATLKLVTAVLDAAPGDLSAAEVAAAIGMSRVGARRYLEHLASSGLAVVEPKYGNAGRPEHRYRASR